MCNPKYKTAVSVITLPLFLLTVIFGCFLYFLRFIQTTLLRTKAYLFTSLLIEEVRQWKHPNFKGEYCLNIVFFCNNNKIPKARQKFLCGEFHILSKQARQLVLVAWKHHHFGTCDQQHCVFVCFLTISDRKSSQKTFQPLNSSSTTKTNSFKNKHRKKKRHLHSLEAYHNKKLRNNGKRLPKYQYPVAPGKSTRKLVSFQQIKTITWGGTCKYQDCFGGDLIIKLHNWLETEEYAEIQAFMSNNKWLSKVPKIISCVHFCSLQI